MNFVFINPPRQMTSGNVWRLINSANPPLGLALLASIWDSRGHTSQIIDAAVLKLSIPQIICRINPKTDFIGITATTPEISGAAGIARHIREKLPHIKIIMGGAHPTVFHQELIADNICDIVVRHEGEIPIRELAQGASPQDIPGLTWKNTQGEIIVNPDAEMLTPLDSLPFPAYPKLPMHLYHSALGAARWQPSIGMVTSRGCPGKCTFCFSEMLGQQVRLTSPFRIIEHIEYLQKDFGIREISFYDDTFTTSIDHVIEFCRQILEKRNKISWSCFARVDTVTPDLLRLMKRAGCHQIMYGFETTEATILKNINKKINVEQFQKAIAWTRTAKINIRGAFMLGSPGETEASMRKTIDFAKKGGIQLAIFNITTPYPGTAMYKEFSRKNSLLHQNWDLYNLGQPVLKLDTVSAEVVRRYYYKGYREFYLRPAFIFRYFFSIRTFSEIRTYSNAIFKISFGLLKSIFSNLFKKEKTS